MKHLSLVPAFILCLATGNCFAQPGHFAGGTSSSMQTIGSMQTNTYMSSSSYSNSSYSNTSSSPRTESTASPVQASAPAVNNNTSYAGMANTTNYTSYIPAGNNSYVTGFATGSNNSTLQTARTAPATRYSYAANKSYNYYSSGHNSYMKPRKNNLKPDVIALHSRHIAQLSLAEHFIPYCANFYFPELFFDNYNSAYPDNNTAYGAASALNVSLDGYAVYGKDTVSGIVTMTNNNVFIEQTVDNKHEYGYHFRYDDKKLKSVVVYNGDNDLLFIRVGKNDDKLSRVVHIGKLSIFDDLYNFSTNLVDTRHLEIFYDGKVETLSAFIVMDMKLKLVKAANKAYGINLNSERFSSVQDIITYINRYY